MRNEVNECIQVLKQLNIKYKVAATGTEMEGEYDSVMQAIKLCHETLHNKGCQRLHSDLKIMSRTDKEKRLEEQTEGIHHSFKSEE